MGEKPITAVMAEALGEAAEHGGKLVRHAGGFWTYPDCPRGHGGWPYLSWHVGTPTVEGLVKRGRLAYTQWRDGRKGSFPVEATVVVTPHD